MKDIQARQSLYNSLSRRSLISPADLTKDVSTSLMASMVKTINQDKSGMISPVELSVRAESWYRKLKSVYDDTELSEPYGWKDFLRRIKEIRDNPDAFHGGIHSYIRRDIDDNAILLTMLGS